MKIRNDRSNDGQPHLAGTPPGQGRVEMSEEEQTEITRAFVAQQNEGQAAQLQAIRAQIVHMLTLSLRILARCEITKKDKDLLAKKMVLAINMQLGSLPEERGCESCEKYGATKDEPKKRGMGFGSN